MMDTIKEMDEKLRNQVGGKVSLKEAVASLLSDPLVRKKMDELGLDASALQKNLPLFLAYQESVHVCENCKGMDKCVANPPCLTMNLTVDEDGFVGRTFGPCKLKEAEEQTRRSYLYHDFDDGLLGLTVFSYGRSKRINEYAKKITNALLSEKTKSPCWVYFTGSCADKNSIVISVCNVLASKGKKIAFLDTNRRFDEFKGISINSKPKFEKTMNEIALCDIVVLDDFGNEYKSDYVRDQILMPLLNYRAKKDLCTIFISDFSLEEIKDLYDNSRASAVIAKRLVSLIEEKTQGVTLVEPGIEDYLKVHQ